MMTSKQYLEMERKKSVTSKYKAIKTVYNGISYDSKAEAACAYRLDLLKQEGTVKEWQRQITFKLVVNDELITSYRLDFLVTYSDDTKEYVDIKGYRKGAAYQIYTLKRKLMKAVYGIDIIEYMEHDKKVA